ncbi:LysE family translocator [Vibrio ostreicida]|uniref:LysE family translocator n=1 Tax=Vibrio ostreicida TaxID=526588 RepID=A0ABT8BUM4_9VIBR|nr:LysE family translocator [Vibrio ostreicida]MDN3609817.1 LysE family translocator [Vibrio ostreicida]
MEAFVIAITILTLTPGLDTALVIRNASRGGRVDGFATSFGICLGLFVHAALSAIGISAILAQSAEWFNLIKMVGAGYLIWLGISTLKKAWKAKAMVSGSEIRQPDIEITRSLREGFLSNILNPKTAVFYLAFLPQFIDPKGSALLQSGAMASIHFIIAMIWQCGLAQTLVATKRLLNSPTFMRRMEVTTGLVLIGLGTKLLLEEA